MRILHVNKFLYRRGGAEAYMEDLAALQTAAGHEVEFFAMTHPSNQPSRFDSHFPSFLETDPPPASIGGKARGAARMLWSTSAQRGMGAVVDLFSPDVVHLHNIYHQLSPSILRPLAARGIPAVMTVHDYKLVCPSYQFLGPDGEVCEQCLGGRFHRCVIRGCKGGSRIASATVAVELAVHTLGRAYSPVARFVCPSDFMRQKLRAGNVFPDRLRHVPHFVVTDGIETKSVAGGPLVFAGRLTHEKAVDVLLEAVGRLDPRVRLVVAGEGPDGEALRSLADRVAPGRVTFVGRLPKDELFALIRSAIAVCVPSRWYENQPLAVLEAFACGVPVVGTALGGIPELIDEGVDGMLAPSGSVDALKEVLQRVVDDPAGALAMGRAARRKAESHFSPARHLASVEAAYVEAGVGVSP